MNSYHDTNHVPEHELPVRKEKAQKQQEVILAWLKEREGEKYTPWEVWDKCFSGRRPPITSVRRSLTNLVTAGKLRDTRLTQEKKIEREGNWNYFWYYPKNNNGQISMI